MGCRGLALTATKNHEVVLKFLVERSETARREKLLGALFLLSEIVRIFLISMIFVGLDL